MTEKEWLECRNAVLMLDRLTNWPSPGTGWHPLATNRKLRLFGCACCRVVWDSLNDQCRHAIRVVERYCDDDNAYIGVLRAIETHPNPRRGEWCVYTQLTGSILFHKSLRQETVVSEIAGNSGLVPFGIQADIVRHIFDVCVECHGTGLVPSYTGRGKRPCPECRAFSAEASKLAQAVYEGDEVAFALHDKLLEEGFYDLALHFKEPWHPRGCFAVDILTGRS